MDLTLGHTGRRRFTRALVALGAGVLSLGVTAACGSSGGNAFSAASSPAAAPVGAPSDTPTDAAAATSPDTSASTSADTSSTTQSITVGGANFNEQVLLTQIYAQALQSAGFKTTVKNVDSREIYLPALRNGQIDVVPEYAATLTSNLATAAKSDVTPSSDIAKTIATLQPLANKAGLTVLKPSQATDQNTFVVSKDFAQKNNLMTLSDLGKLNKPLRIAAGAECKDRPFCAPGLRKTYGINATVDPTGAGTAPSFQAVKNGTDQLALAFTSDGTFKNFGLVELKDDKKLQASDNIVAVVNTASIGKDQKVIDVLNKVDAALTTSDLQDLNRQIGVERAQPQAVAKKWLSSHPVT